MELKYGKEKESFQIKENNIKKILKANERVGLKKPLKEMQKAIANPIGTKSLQEMAAEKDPEKVVIIVNDVSRPTPYEYMLQPLLEALHQVGLKEEQITLIVATGVHDPHTEEQSIQIFGQEIIDKYRLVFHNPDENLIDLGKLSSGNQLYINREVIEADFVITTGVILPHYFAGFSGGRKSILPGVAGRQTIEFNHSHMIELMNGLPSLKENPVSLEMIEAARRVGVDFILNVVTNSKREIVKVVAGDLEQAWYEGIETSSAMYHVQLEERVDVTIVSPGGYPRDFNVYQTQKALDHADHGTKEGGVIILLAECPEGLGEKTFEEWMETAERPEDNVERIKEKFVIGGHKAFAISRVAINKEIIMISSLDKATTELLFAQKMATVQEALDYVEKRYNGDYDAIIMPQGSLTVPVTH